MKYEIYCDESHPDVFWSASNMRGKYLLIGGMWLPADRRKEIERRIKRIRKKYSFPHEIKWHKVHTDTEAFYKELVDLFFEYGDLLRFRCIAVDAEKVDLVRFHNSDAELGFYKFYYQMIVHWILDFNEYRIFCDEKTNRAGDRLGTLKKVLNYANISSKVISVQALPSKEAAIIQFVDILLGIASSRMNNSIAGGSAKERIIQYLEKKLGVTRLGPTKKYEQKFNIFKINLWGGW